MFYWTRLSYLPICLQAGVLKVERKECSGIPGLGSWYTLGQLDLVKLPDLANFKSALRAALVSHPTHGLCLFDFSRKPTRELQQQPRQIYSERPSDGDLVAKPTRLR